MFRAFRFALAIALCASASSTAHAAGKPPTFEPMLKTLEYRIFSESAVHYGGPYKPDAAQPSMPIKERMKKSARQFLNDVNLIIGPAGFCMGWATCKNTAHSLWIWFNSELKEVDRAD